MGTQCGRDLADVLEWLKTYFIDGKNAARLQQGSYRRVALDQLGIGEPEM